MPDYTKLRSMVSHRVTLDYDTGVRVVGYLAGCKPAEGPVHLVTIAKAEVLDGKGRVLAQSPELSVVPNILTGFRVTEGPGGF